MGIWLLLALLTYNLLGFVAVPMVVQRALTGFVSDKLKLQATLAHVAFNPWSMALRLDGLSIRDPQAGEALVAAQSIYVRAGVLSSLWIRGGSLAELDLQQPYINAHLDHQGVINLLKLVPPADPKAAPAKSGSSPNWRIGKLGIHAGHIDFRDDTRPTPFSAVFSPLNISLDNISSRPNKQGEYAFSADTGHGEKLRWHGTLAMAPLRSSGHLDIEDLQATTPWSYVQDSVPVVVKSGLISIGGDYQLTLDQAVALKLDHGSVSVSKLLLEQKAVKEPLAISLDQLSLGGLQLDWPLHAANVHSLEFKGFGIIGKTGAGPLINFQRLAFDDIGWQAGAGELSLKQLELDQLGLRDDKAGKLFELPALVINSVQATLPKHSLHVENIKLDGGTANLHVLPENRVDWQLALTDLARRAQASVPPAKADAASKPAPAWAWSLGELDLSHFRVNAEDQRFKPAVLIPVQDINLRIKPRQGAGQPHELEGSLALGFGGKLSLQGTLEDDPLKATAHLGIAGLNIPPLAPYFADIGRFSLKSGQLDLDGKLGFAQGTPMQASFDGRVAVNDFAANDLDLDQRFLAWKQLAAEDISFKLSPMSLSIRQVVADAPYTRMIVTPDYKLNFQHIFASASSNTVQQKPAPKKAVAGPVMPVKIGQVLVKSGSMLFADLTLKPQFATGIQNLNGDIRGISGTGHSMATISLNGRVDQFGTANITGQLDPLASDQNTDLSVKFGNLELTTLTPYAAKFAGYRIDQGKLSLNLNYKIRQRQLQASNSVVLNQLTLGDKVDSPDAMHLPLKLALAILRDSDGNINLDLPVSGSLDDPDFHVGPIIWKAFVNVLTKVAEAPFKFIARLVGGGDDIDSIAFVPGAAALNPNETAKLNKVAAALRQRPALRLNLRGAYDTQADTLALQSARFDADYAQAAAAGGKEEKILEGLYSARVGKEQLAELRALSLKPSGDSAAPALILSMQTYVQALRNELTKREAITDSDLRQLALKRARAIRDQVVLQNQVDDSRVFVQEPQTVSAQNNLVVTTITVDAP
jgi:hypothetical protein